MSPAKQLCVTTKKMLLPARHTDRRTDRQTPDKVIPMCRYASQATQKPQHLKKMSAQVIFWIRIYSEFRRDLFSANTMYIYMVSFF